MSGCVVLVWGAVIMAAEGNRYTNASSEWQKKHPFLTNKLWIAVYRWLPTAFTSLDSILILIALVKICHILRFKHKKVK